MGINTKDGKPVFDFNAEPDTKAFEEFLKDSYKTYQPTEPVKTGTFISELERKAEQIKNDKNLPLRKDIQD